MSNLKKKLSKVIAVALAAVTVSSASIIGATAYSTYGSETTPHAIKNNYGFYKYGASKCSYTAIYCDSTTTRFVIPQVIILKKGSNNTYTEVEDSVSNPGVLKRGYKTYAGISQSSSYRKYWHRGVLKEDTSYSSNAYHVFSYYKSF